MAGSADKQSEAPVVRASARYVRVAPRKARLVADQVRGMPVPEARTLLDFSTRGAARDIGKLIASAAANAEANHELVADDLQIAEINVDDGSHGFLAGVLDGGQGGDELKYHLTKDDPTDPLSIIYALARGGGGDDRWDITPNVTKRNL